MNKVILVASIALSVWGQPLILSQQHDRQEVQGALSLAQDAAQAYADLLKLDGEEQYLLCFDNTGEDTSVIPVREFSKVIKNTHVEVMHAVSECWVPFLKIFFTIASGDLEHYIGSLEVKDTLRKRFILAEHTALVEDIRTISFRLQASLDDSMEIASEQSNNASLKEGCNIARDAIVNYVNYYRNFFHNKYRSIYMMNLGEINRVKGLENLMDDMRCELSHATRTLLVPLLLQSRKEVLSIIPKLSTELKKEVSKGSKELRERYCNDVKANKKFLRDLIKLQLGLSPILRGFAGECLCESCQLI